MKFLKLKRRLGLPHWQVVGLLESLWLFTQLNSPQGDIGKHSDEDIAAGIEWEGEHEKLIRELVECGWLDRCDIHRLLVHDWEDHVPTYLKGSMAKYGQEFAKHGAELPPKKPAKQSPKDGAKQNQTDTQHTAGSVHPRLGESGLVGESQAKPIFPPAPDGGVLTSSNGSKNGRRPRRDKTAEELDPIFLRFWEAYPRKINKPESASAFAKLKATEELLKKILAAIERWSRTEDWTKENGKYIPYPQKWINQRGWENEMPRVLFSIEGGKVETPEQRAARHDWERRRDLGEFD